MNAAKPDFKIFPPILDGPQPERVNTEILLTGGFIGFFSMYCIQHCVICRPSDSTGSEDARIEPRTVAIFSSNFFYIGQQFFALKVL